jgi:hypothetical protein
MPTAFIECNENITCYTLIDIFMMLVGEGCEHLSELKKLALSCDASLLEDFPKDLGRIAKRLVKNWWIKHGLLFCMQKIEEENPVSFVTLYYYFPLLMKSDSQFFHILKLMEMPKVRVPVKVMP